MNINIHRVTSVTEVSTDYPAGEHHPAFTQRCLVITHDGAASITINLFTNHPEEAKEPE